MTKKIPIQLDIIINDNQPTILKEPKCNGITSELNACPNYTIDDTDYCNSHQYMIKFTTNDIKNIKIGKMKLCTGCTHWHNEITSRCMDCLNNNKNRYHKKTDKYKCHGITQNGDPCSQFYLKDSNFCETHQYMNEYTKVQMANLKVCVRCKKQMYLEKHKQCQSCIDKDAVKRALKKAKKAIIVAKE